MLMNTNTKSSYQSFYEVLFSVDPSKLFKLFRTKNSIKSDVLNFQKIFVKSQLVFSSNCSYKKVYFDMIEASHNILLFRVSNMSKLFRLLWFFVADLVQVIVFWEFNYLLIQFNIQFYFILSVNGFIITRDIKSIL